MARYVVLVNWTEQGIRSVKETVSRSKAFRQAAKSMDCEIADICWTLGPYDIVSIVDAPNDEVVTRLGLILGMQGNVKTTTLRAFGESEMERIIKSLP